MYWILDIIPFLCYDIEVFPEWANREVHIPGRENKDEKHMIKLRLQGLMAGILRRVENLQKIKTKTIEEICDFINKEKIVNLTKKISTVSLTLKVATFSLIMATVPAGTLQINAKNATAVKPYNTSLKLDTSKSYVLASDENKPDIKIGESEFDKKEREARELAEANREVVVRESTSARTSEAVVSDNSTNNGTYDADDATKHALAKKAASRYGIDWKILEAVWQVESGRTWNSQVTSYAGAQGPMQFMPGTWNKYAVDGNGDGIADVNYAEDAVYAGANLLAQAGAAEGDVDSALFSYNHAQWYVDMVKDVAASYGD